MVYEKLGNLGIDTQYKNMADTCQRDSLIKELESK